MRPAGQPTQALLRAARELCTPGRGATLSELADRACVGRQVARDLVPKLKSRGHLEIVATRRVDNRNRPVAEYAPAAGGDEPQGGFVELLDCLQLWAR